MLRGDPTRVCAGNLEGDLASGSKLQANQSVCWLWDVLHSLHSANSLEECLDLSLCLLEQRLDYDMAGIALLEGDTLVPAAMRSSLVEDGPIPDPVEVTEHGLLPKLAASSRPISGKMPAKHAPWLMLGAQRPGGYWLISPLLSGTKLIGQLSVYRQGRRDFDSTDLDTVALLSPHLGVALGNSRRLLETSREAEALWAQSKHLRRLLESLPRLGTELDPDALLWRVLGQAIAAIPEVQSGLLFVPEGETLICRAVHGYDLTLLRAHRLPLSAFSALGQGLRQVFRLPPSSPWWSHAPSDVQETLARSRFGHQSPSPASLVMPIQLADELLSVVVLENWDNPGLVNTVSQEIAQLFAVQSAVAITNARLYHMVREYATTLEARVQERTAEIRDAKERSEAILRSVADGMVVTDLEGRIVEANPVAAAWLEHGVDGQKLPNRRLEEFVAGVAQRDGAELPSMIEFPTFAQPAGAQQTGVLCPSCLHCEVPECPVRDAPDAPCWLARAQAHHGTDEASDRCAQCVYYANLPKIALQAHAAPIAAEDGSVMGTVIVLRDISKLRELDRLKSQFVSNVSHELRTPLSNIKLYLSLLRRGRMEKRDHYLAILDEETNRLSQLIEDLLDLSRLENGRTQIPHAQQAWQDIIPQVLETYRPQFEARHLDLEVDIAPDTPAMRADRNQLIQVLTNLVNNAINYTKPHGRIWIRTRPWCDERGVWARLVVQDTGMGISEADQAHIFDRFYRGVAEGLGIPGSGLGLTIVKETVEVYGGSITVQSQVGVGSAFTVLLPASPEAGQ